MAKTPSKGYTPENIVARWRQRFDSRLKPWYVKDSVGRKFERALKQNIKELLEGGAGRKKQVFTSKDMRASLRVAGDVARICKILQPAPFPKEISFDTLESVLDTCANFHNVCQGPSGAGGWCDIG